MVWGRDGRRFLAWSINTPAEDGDPGLTEGSDLYVYTDGAARGNPGPAASGYAAFDASGRLVGKGAKYIGRRTNNEAEYEALIWAIQRAEALGASDVKAYSDSELMVRQVNGVYRVKKEHLKPLVEEVRARASAFKRFRLVSVPREDERIQLVDALVNEVLDREGF